MCSIFSISRSAYYRWLNCPVSNRTHSNKLLDGEIKCIYEKHKGNYGSPRATRELLSKGIKCSENKVAKRMKLMKLIAKTKKKFRITTDSKHSLPVSPNLLERDFSTKGINQKWVGDITYVHTQEGWLFLATVIDLHSRSIIGWLMNKRMTTALVCNAILMALWNRKFPKGVIMHTDRGSQYCSYAYQNLLKLHGLRSSMSRRGNCWDNAVAESFFKTLKSELVYETTFQTRAAAKMAIFSYIEGYYNRQRRHSSLDYRTPFEVECELLEVA
jgi:putative transposase